MGHGGGSALPSREKVMRVLIDVAQRRKTISYSELGAAVGLPTRGPHWKAVLDDVSLNRPDGTPDITVLVVNKATGLPGQVDFERVSAKSLEVASRVVAEQEAVWTYYRQK